MMKDQSSNKSMKRSKSYSMKNINRTNDKFKLNQDDEQNFIKISGYRDIRISGFSPVTVYKKRIGGQETKERLLVKRQIKNNSYISDGGLKNKIQKFNNGIEDSSSKKKKKKNLNKSDKKSNLYFKKSNFDIDDKKIFSKTADFKKILNFPKNSEKKKKKNVFREKYKNLKDINKQREQQNLKNLDKTKIEYMNHLCESGLANEIRKYQIPKKLTQKELKTERKKICLLDNGIEINNIEDENTKDDKTNDSLDMLKPKMNSLIKSQPELSHYRVSIESQMSPRSKKIYKQPVDQLEYIVKIKAEVKKLLNNSLSKSNSLDSFRRRNNKTKIDFMNNYINKQSDAVKLKNSINESESTNDSLPFSHRKSHRTPQELKDFLNLKKKKEKESIKTKDMENNKKLFIRFRNLYNLHMKDVYEEQYQDIIPNIRGKMNKSKLAKSFSKKKEINEYYIGSEQSLRNNSTIVDQGEYYLHILESQQLLVNSKLKKIDNIPNESETHEEEKIIQKNNENENNSEMNSSKMEKEQINQMTDKESKKSNKSLTIQTSSDINLENMDELKKKISNTLKREGEIFAQKTKQDINAETTNSNLENKNDDNNLINKVQKNIQDNLKEIRVKGHDLNIDTNNKITSSEINTKEKNIPSLSHTYSTNSNPNKRVEIDIEPRAVLNLVEIIKFIYQRKTFVTLYESYINVSIFQQYNIAFSYFVAICKHNAFKKIEEYANYRTYNLAFRQLFRPMIRRAYKNFIKNCYLKKKLEYLILLLTKMFKFKIMEKIYLYNHTYDDNKENIKIIIMKILSKLINPYLKVYFNEFIYKVKNIQKKSSSNKKSNNKKNSNDNSLSIENDRYKNLEINSSSDKKAKIDKKNFKNELAFKNLHEESYSFNEKDFSLKKADISIKMNTFMHYTSENDSKSSISIEPNSVDNDKLHKLNQVLELRNRLMYGGLEDELYGYQDFRYGDNSLDSESQMKYIKSMENKNKKISDNNTNSISLVDNSAQKSNHIEKEESKNGEEEEFDVKQKEEDRKEDNKEEIKDKEKIKKEQIQEDKKKKIQIEIEDIPIIKSDSHNSKHSQSEIDISAEKEINNDIEWEYNISASENKNKNNKNSQEKNNDYFNLDDLEEINDNNNEKVKKEENSEKKESPKKNDDYGTFDEISLENIGKVKEEEKIDEKKEQEKFNIIKNDVKQDKSRNLKQEKDNNLIEVKEQKILKDDSTKEIKDKGKPSSIDNIEKIKSIKDVDKFSNSLIDEIIKKLLTTEILSSKKKLIPPKKFSFEKFDKMNTSNLLSNSLTNSYGSVGDIRSNTSNLSREFGLANMNQISLHDDFFSLNDSLLSNYSSFSIFNKTVKDKKKERSLKLYITKIAPKLLKLLHKELVDKYKYIYKNISTPLKNNSEKFMISLTMQDSEMLKENYKCLVKEEKIENIIDKDKILKEFSHANKIIRSKDNVVDDNFYDNILNDCIIDTAIELIYKERLYGKNGTPLKWSSRTHELKYKYSPNDGGVFATNICKKIWKILNNRIGLIGDNYDFLNTEQLNSEKDRRLLILIKKDLNENEYQWNNLELEETQLKIESADSILDQLFNEIIEILEHVQFSRLRPELYQYKSIYACEEIPKLSFQQTTTEDINGIGDGDENVINI